MISKKFIFASFLLLAACTTSKKEETVQPVLRVQAEEVFAFSATFKVNALGVSNLRYGLDRDMSFEKETPGTGPVTITLGLDGLQSLTDYTLYIQGIGPQGLKSDILEHPFSTLEGPETVYPGEEERTSIPSFADLSLITLGWHNSNPPAWTAERFASHVSNNGKWLFDAFLCIDGWDPLRNLSYSITPSRSSATRESWEDLADAWLGEDGALNELDKAVAEAASVLGKPAKPRYVVMSVPDPVRYSFFGDPSSSTTYWGSLGDEVMDFSNTRHQVAAYKWYMDLCRQLFHEREFRYLELAGFYVLSEELPLNPSFYRSAGESYTSGIDDWNWEKKNWEIIIPEVSAYAHSCMDGLWWIPYHMAPGYKVWRNLGFDMAWMQPNYYWDHDSISHPLAVTEGALKTYGMGIELEFEYSLVASVMADGRSGPDGNGSPIFYANDVPMLRNRVRSYMDMYKRTGNYGKCPIAVYSGTDAWHQLATSPDPEDQAMFAEICNFITESALKR